MTPDEFKEIRARLGLTTSGLAKQLCVTPRLVQMMATGQSPVTPRTQAMLRLLLESHKESA